MKTYIVKTVTEERKTLDKSYCDKCARLIKYENHTAYKSDWFRVTFGTNYPEGGNGVDKVMDLCEECARKLVEILSANGYEIRDEEWEW